MDNVFLFKFDLHVGQTKLLKRGGELPNIKCIYFTYLGRGEKCLIKKFI